MCGLSEALCENLHSRFGNYCCESFLENSFHKKLLIGSFRLRCNCWKLCEIPSKLRCFGENYLGKFICENYLND